MEPSVSVVVEGYNQTRQLGEADDTVAALMAQNFPLAEVELILVGSPEQAEHWARTCARDSPFHSVKTVPCESVRYYDLKNLGAAVARGEIIAFTDSDVLPRPGWISAIVENIRINGADVSLGPSLFGRKGVHDPDSLFMRTAASITWGWVFGRRLSNGRPEARGFMDHNVAMRREVAAQFRYNTEYGRIIASPLLFRALKDGGKAIAIHPRQQAVHGFSLGYWLIGLQLRYGHEVYRLRRLDKKYPLRWIRKLGPLEPLATLFLHMGLDVAKWFRMNRALEKSPMMATLFLPAFLAVSLVARIFEMLGLYSTMVFPARTNEWAQQV